MVIEVNLLLINSVITNRNRMQNLQIKKKIVTYKQQCNLSPSFNIVDEVCI
jgi:hypothetical protein